MSFSFKLYVTGDTPRSERAILNLRRLCQDRLGDGYTLEVIDVLEQPDVAEHERVLATPLLVKVTPPPVRRVTGDLGDEGRLLALLALDPAPNGSNHDNP